MIKYETEANKKTKKKVIIKKKTKQPGEDKDLPSSDSESGEKEEIPVPVEPEHTQKDADLEKPLESVTDHKEPSKTVPGKPDKNKTPKKVGEEEGTFVKPKLRKSEPVKRNIETAKIETVSLKSHTFEKSPQDNPKEQKSKIRL